MSADAGGGPRRDFAEGSVIGAVARMGFPSMIGFAAASLYDIVDMFWVSRLPGAPVAALTFFFPLLFLLTSVNQIAGAGSVAVISRRYGEGDLVGAEAAIKDATILKILLALFVGGLSFLVLEPGLRLVGTTPEAWAQAVAYGRVVLLGLVANFSSYTMFTALRGVGDPRQAMFLMLSGVLLNLALDPLLIFGIGPLPALGVAGAAVASVIAYAFTFAAGLVIFYTGRSNVRLRLAGGPPLSLLRMGRMLRIGIPSGVSSLSFSLGRTVVMPWIAVYGTAVVAAYGVAMRLAGFGIMLIVGMGLGLSALIGQTLGTGDKQRTWETGIASLRFTVAAMAVFGALLFAGAPLRRAGLLRRGPRGGAGDHHPAHPGAGAALQRPGHHAGHDLLGRRRDARAPALQPAAHLGAAGAGRLPGGAGLGAALRGGLVGRARRAGDSARDLLAVLPHPALDGARGLALNPRPADRAGACAGRGGASPRGGADARRRARPWAGGAWAGG